MSGRPVTAVPTIVAMGGIEFSMRPENDAIHDYVVGLCEAERPRVCHLPTASGDPREQIAAFHSSMGGRWVEASVLSLFRLGETGIDVREHLLGQDLIYVGGGSMVNLIALWREHGIDEVMRDAYAAGVVLCGYSAGSMCWFSHGVSRGSGRPSHSSGLGLLAGSHCVHYSQDPGRRSAYRELVGSGKLPAGLALDDHAAALFREGERIEIVRSREGAGGYWVRPPEGGAGEVEEEQLASRLITSSRRRAEHGVEEMRRVRRLRAG